MSDAPAFDMPNTAATFEERGGWVVNRLMQDLAPLTLNQSGGAVGNIGFESGGFKILQEERPAVAHSRGGYGWPQWTGPRRTAFEHWCADHDYEVCSDEANYGYLVEELRTSQAHALEQLRKTTTLEAAVFTFGYHFENPRGTTSTHLPGYADRLHYAQRAIAGAVGLASASPATPAASPASPAAELNQQELERLLGEAVAANPQAAPATSTPASRPVHTAIASAGLAASTVVSAVWGFHEFGIDVPENVQTAWVVIVTAIGAGLLHWRPGLAAAVPPSPPPDERKS